MSKSNKQEKSIEKLLETWSTQPSPPPRLPEHLKEQVFQSLHTLELLGTLADLFFVKFARSWIDIAEEATPSTDDPDETHSPT